MSLWFIGQVGDFLEPRCEIVPWLLHQQSTRIRNSNISTPRLRQAGQRGPGNRNAQPGVACATLVRNDKE
jgi:hypothetical protein